MSRKLQKEYLLSTHIYLCQTSRGVVALDLRHDRYLGLEAGLCHYLSSRVEGWPTSSQPSPSLSPSAEQHPQMLEDMLVRGILTDDPNTGKSAAPVSIPHPISALIEGYTQVPINTEFVNILRCLAAILRSRSLLRGLSIEQLATAVKTRTAKIRFHHFDVETAQHHVASFIRMRTYLFSAHNACLFDSLALRNYLCGHGLPSMWVFGVKPYPFAAHCWLQHGGIVLNDTPENVRNYTPIMVI